MANARNETLTQWVTTGTQRTKDWQRSGADFKRPQPLKKILTADPSKMQIYKDKQSQRHVFVTSVSRTTNFNPHIHLITSKQNRTGRNHCYTLMVTGALFARAERQKQHWCLPTDRETRGGVSLPWNIILPLKRTFWGRLGGSVG